MICQKRFSVCLCRHFTGKSDFMSECININEKLPNLPKHREFLAIENVKCISCDYENIVIPEENEFKFHGTMEELKKYLPELYEKLVKMDE